MKEKKERKVLSVEDKFFLGLILFIFILGVAWLVSEYGKDIVTLFQLIFTQ